MICQVFNSAFILSLFIFLKELECVPLPNPQYTYYNGYQTGVGAGTHYHDPHYVDCYESSVHGGVAAHSQIGAGIHSGIHSGGMRCKQGKRLLSKC